MSESRNSTLIKALKDIGWFPGLLIALGGFSVLSVVEQAVYREPIELVQPFEWAKNGYERILNLLGEVVRLCVQPFLDWAKTFLGWNIELNSIWRHFFVLLVVPVLALSRAAFSSGRREGLVTFFLVALSFAFAASILAGLVPLGTRTWTRFLLLAPIIGLSAIALSTALLEYAYYLDEKLKEEGRFRIIGRVVMLLGAVVVWVAARATVDAVGEISISGLVTCYVIYALALYGGHLTIAGMVVQNVGYARVGLTILGGFVAAALVLIGTYLSV